MHYDDCHHADDSDGIANTYQGRRTDLREKPSKDEIKREALDMMAYQKGEGRPGIFATELARWCDISREWARKVLTEMRLMGLLRLHPVSHARFFLFLPNKEAMS